MEIGKRLFDEHIKPKNKVKLYNFLCEIENNGVYNNRPANSDSDLAKIIYDNYHNMTMDEMRHFVSKCLSDTEVMHILLKYELKNLQYDKTDKSLRTFGKIANKILFRYQSRAGGFQFGDRLWKTYDKTSKKYHLFDNELIFENTIDANSFNDHETIEYIRDILNMLNSIAYNIKVSLHTKYLDRDKTYIMMLKCVENKTI